MGVDGHGAGKRDRDVLPRCPAQNVVLWEWNDDALARAFRADGLGDYPEVDATAFSGLSNRTLDQVLDAAVSLARSGASVTVRVVPLDGGTAVTTTLAVPTGATVRQLYAAWGKTFMLLEVAGSQELRWFDSLTGEPGGFLALPRYSDEVWPSTNGRALVVWDLDGWVAHVVDAADPVRLRTVALGACRSNSIGEVSADGHWFVFADCRGNLRLADLTDLAAGSSPLGARLAAGLRFAKDTPELVWIDTAGAVRALDVTTDQVEVVHQLTSDERAGLDLEWPWWYTPIYLDRTAGMLALSQGRGRVALVDLVTASAIVAVPRPEFDSATLELVAVPGDALSSEHYEYTFSGSMAVVGENLSVEGHVNAYGFHEYVPATALQAAAVVHSLHGEAQAWAEGEDDPSYSLWFGTRDRLATSYNGGLSSADGTLQYLVRLRRAAP
ncbi:MAG TPA: hypothetical protein VFN03_06700 [Trueperaceae bacterium]|nr:hypothetical protein [Trueperaceae bacterium]